MSASHRSAILTAIVAASLLAGAAPARATYSIVGVDRTTRHVGVSGTSCVAPSSVFVIYGSAPGKGAVASQAAANQAGRNRAVQRLMMDVAPADIITELTSAAFDPGAASRQYGVVDVTGRAAGHSGARNGDFADDRQGAAGDFNYSVQGNILTSAAVLTQAAAAFERPACDLAERLMRALEAGGQNGQGDSRCTPFNAPGDSAFVAVDRPGETAGSYLRIRVDGPRRMNPLPTLRARFDEWRMTHPCPGDAPDGGSPPRLDAAPGRDGPPAGGTGGGGAGGAGGRTDGGAAGGTGGGADAGGGNAGRGGGGAGAGGAGTGGAAGATGGAGAGGAGPGGAGGGGGRGVGGGGGAGGTSPPVGGAGGSPPVGGGGGAAAGAGGNGTGGGSSPPGGCSCRSAGAPAGGGAGAGLAGVLALALRRLSLRRRSRRSGSSPT